MCRLFLSINRKLDGITLMNFFSQAKEKKFTPGLSNPLDSDYHLDGYGITWFDDSDELTMYKSSTPYNIDLNFQDIFDQVIKSRFVLAHLRNQGTTSVGNPAITNSHPFICGNYVLAHNGFIKNFSTCKEQILNFISDKYFQKISGETDTEHLFYCLLTIIDNLKMSHVEDGLSFEELYQMAWENLFEFFSSNSIELVGNFIFTDLNIVVVIRYISPGFTLDGLAILKGFFSSNKPEPPSLYFCSDIAKTSVIICSEPVGQTYTLVETNCFMTFHL